MAASPRYETPTAGYSRRLRSVLSDPEYGPKLVRLSRADQQRVQQLVNRSEGRAARKLINELDEKRRAGRRAADRAHRYAALPSDQRIMDHPDDEVREFWASYDRSVKAA